MANEWQRRSRLGYSYEEVRAMSDREIIKAGHDSGDRLAAELANRYDVVGEKLRHTDPFGADKSGEAT